MRKPVVALVSQPFDGVLPPYQNSIGIYIYEVAQRLSDLFEVHVVTVSRPNRPEPAQVGSVHFHYLSQKRDEQASRLVKFLPGVSDPGAFDNRFYRRFYACQAARTLGDVGCQVAYLFNFAQFGPILRQHNPGLKLTLQMRCEWLSQLDRDWVAMNLRSFDSVIGCSRHITELAAARFPAAGARFSTIYNAIDGARFAYRPELVDNGSKRILFVGRLSPEKGVHTLLSAFAIARRQEPELSLCLVGGKSQLPAEMLVDLSDDPLVEGLRRFYATGAPDEYWQHIQKEIRENDLASVVSTPGNLPYEQVVEYFASSAMLVNPSLSESFGRSPAEACAIGLPVVASRVGGLCETIVDGETGLLVDPDQPDKLAAAMLRMIRDAPFRRSAAKAAHQRMEERFSWQSISGQIAEHCRSLLTSEQK